MLSDLISAIIRGLTFHGFDQLTHFRRAHSPFSAWKAATNEVIAIYPITPSSVMGEVSDAKSAAGEKNMAAVSTSGKSALKAAAVG